MEECKYSSTDQIDGVRQAAFSFAMKRLLPVYLVQMVRYVRNYAMEEVEEIRAYSLLAEQFVQTAKHCPAFNALSYSELLHTLTGENLIGSEDEILDAVLKWIDMQREANESQTETRYSYIRLDRLKSRFRQKELRVAKKSPPCLLDSGYRLYLRRIEADEAWENVRRSLYVDPECVQFYISGQDSALGFATHFCWRQIAMSGILFGEDETMFLRLSIDRRIAPGSSSFRELAARTKLDVFIVETSAIQDDWQTKSVHFQDNKQFQSCIALPASKSMKIMNRAFWCFISEHGSSKKGTATCHVDQYRKKRLRTQVRGA